MITVVITVRNNFAPLLLVFNGCIISYEFFGFYNMLTKFAHILGPVLIGVSLFFSDDPRSILLAILPMFVLGALILTQVKVPEDAA